MSQVSELPSQPEETHKTLQSESLGLDEFLVAISQDPEIPIMQSPPCLNQNNWDQVQQEIIESTPNRAVTSQRQSSRLAAKAKTRVGPAKGVLELAQELLASKFNEFPSDDKETNSCIFEQIASQFTRPINKGKMEAIMTLVDQVNAEGNCKARKKKKNSKVVPAVHPGPAAA